jgi:hypothetical protein
VEIQKGMTFREVKKALGEFTVTEDHKKELAKVIAEKFVAEVEEEV